MTAKTLLSSALIAAASSALFLSSAISATAKSDKKSSQTKRQLQLNGSATRTVLGFEVYDVDLYVTRTSKNENMIYKDTGKKRVQIKMLREVKGKKFESTVRKNIDTNFSSAEKKKYNQDLERFLGCFVHRTLAENTVVHIDYLPGKGTRVSVQGKQLELIAGDEFYHALLRLWIGNPPQKSVKQGLLGKA